MKALARSYFWWPGLDKDIESSIKSCNGCERNKRDPKLAPLHPWECATKPWERIHVDFAGPLEGKMYLTAMDAFSKWPEVVIMDTTTTSKTIDALRDMFARWGLPHQLATDNGPQFTSIEFENFIKRNGVVHIRSALYHPATNKLAERFVQSFKQALHFSKKEKHSLIE